ncbi:MAG: WD40 repeat domain-containing protein [Gammaproteobacteria bacterium]|nr:WD40 repeat domain-containing protein [Gammaproteobacteria bacterium]
MLQGRDFSQGLDNQAVRKLVDAHLLRAEKRLGATWFELAHDRLIEPVRQNNAHWFETNLSLLQKQSGLWEKQHRSAALLFRDKILYKANIWAESHAEELTAADRDFLAACHEAQAVANKERRQNRLVRATAVIAVLTSIVAGWFYWEALKQADKMLVRDLAIQSRLYRTSRPQLGVLLSLQALAQSRASGGYANYAEEALREALAGISLDSITLYQTGAISAVAFSPDENWLAVGGEKGRLTAGKKNGYVHDLWENWLAAEGEKAGTGKKNTYIRLWDLNRLESAKIPLELQGKGEHLAFSPDSRLLLALHQHDAYLWDVSKITPYPLQGHNADISAYAFNPKAPWLATGGADSDIRLWNLDPPRNAAVLKGHNSAVRALAFSPDGHWLASGGLDRTIRLWDLRAGMPDKEAYILQTPDSVTLELRFSKRGHWLLARDTQNRINAWRASNFSPFASAETFFQSASEDTEAMQKTVFSPNRQWLATAKADRSLGLWDLRALPSEALGVLERKQAQAATSGTITIVRAKEDWLSTPETTENQTPVTHFVSGHDADITALAVSSRGHWLASGSRDETVRLWRLGQAFKADAKPTVLLKEMLVKKLAFTQADATELAVQGKDGVVRVLDLHGMRPMPKAPDNNEILIPAKPSPPEWAVKMKRSGEREHPGYKTQMDEEIKKALYGTSGSGEKFVFTGLFAMNVTKRWLALPRADYKGRFREIELFKLDWSEEHRKPLDKKIVSPAHISAVALNADAHWLATGSEDGIVRLWDLHQTDHKLKPVSLHGHTQAVLALSFSRDSRFLASAGGDKTVRLWPVQLEELIAVACRTVGRELSEEEREEFLGGHTGSSGCESNKP